MTHTLTLSWSNGTGVSLTKAVQLTNQGEANLDVTVPNATTDLHALLAIDQSALKMLYILSDKDITIETNSSSAPDDTLTISANKPLVWYDGEGITCPITADVTDLYLTNAGGTSATVNIRTLQDATP